MCAEEKALFETSPANTEEGMKIALKVPNEPTKLVMLQWGQHWDHWIAGGV